MRRPTPRRGLVVLGVALLVLGLALGGWFARTAYLDPVVDVAAAGRQVGQLEQQWSSATASPTPAGPSSSPKPGPAARVPDQAVALLRIPAFGAGFSVAVLDGTSENALSQGVGWFHGSAGPGEVGNFAVAGHRGTSGPFVRLLELGPGAEVIVETRDRMFTYRLTNRPAELTVHKREVWVVDPVPGQSGVEPSKALLTLVTCRNFFRSPERSIAFGELVDTRLKHP